MSVQMHFTITISGYDPQRESAIRQAVAAFLDDESLDEDFGSLAVRRTKAGPVLGAATHGSVPVSGSYRWLPQAEKKFRRVVAKANGKVCVAEFCGEHDETEFAGDDEDEDDD